MMSYGAGAGAAGAGASFDHPRCTAAGTSPPSPPISHHVQPPAVRRRPNGAAACLAQQGMPGAGLLRLGSHYGDREDAPAGQCLLVSTAATPMGLRPPAACWLAAASCSRSLCCSARTLALQRPAPALCGGGEPCTCARPSTHRHEDLDDLLACAVGHVLHQHEGLLVGAAADHVQHAADLGTRQGGSRTRLAPELDWPGRSSVTAGAPEPIGRPCAASPRTMVPRGAPAGSTAVDGRPPLSPSPCMPCGGCRAGRSGERCPPWAPRPRPGQRRARPRPRPSTPRAQSGERRSAPANAAAGGDERRGLVAAPLSTACSRRMRHPPHAQRPA